MIKGLKERELIRKTLGRFVPEKVASSLLDGGVVTQFQGDAILATFNVPVNDPEHAANAIHAARKMLNHTNQRQFAGQVLSIRIGINSGTVFAGAIGAEGRLNYTVHGDAVNLAARLEAMNKEFGTRLLISENTQRLTNQFELQKLGETSVRGQSKRVSLYTLPEINS